MTIQFSMHWFSFRYVTLPIDVFPADHLVLQKPGITGKKQFLLSVLDFLTKKKQIQLNAQITHDSM